MSKLLIDKPAQAAPSLSRRHVFAGAGAAAALAATAAALPLPDPKVADPARGDPAAGEGGYRLTDHVKRYYRSARL